MNVCDEEMRYILKFYYKKGKNATLKRKMMYALDALSQLKSVLFLRKWNKIYILVATTLLKNWMLIIKQFTKVGIQEKLNIDTVSHWEKLFLVDTYQFRTIS